MKHWLDKPGSCSPELDAEVARSESDGEKSGVSCQKDVVKAARSVKKKKKEEYFKNQSYKIP